MIKSVMIVVKHLIYGGTEKYTLNLANSLAERGIEVVLVTSGGPLADHLSSKVKVFYAPIGRKARDKRVSERKILEVAEKFKPEIIHTQCRTAMVCSQLARAYLNIPLITHEHHMYDDKDYPLIVDELDINSDRIITIGPYTSRKLIKYGMKKEKIITIINGVDIKSIVPIKVTERQEYRKMLNLKSTDKVIVCLSRIVKGKGIDKLILGFYKVVKKIPNAKLIIAGDDDEGDMNVIIENTIKVKKLQKKLFLFPGEYDIRKYHAVADVFCYPALCKGMAVMEAMAAGLPVVGKKTTKKPLAVEDGISGLMTEPTSKFLIDPDEIAEKLIHLLENPRKTHRMGKAARKRIVEKYNLEKMITKVLRSYNQTIKDHDLNPSSDSEILWGDNKPLFY